MFKTLVRSTIAVWGGVILLVLKPASDYERLHADIDPASLEGSVGRPQDSMWLVRVDMEFTGEFVTLADGQRNSVYTRSFQGNAFAVDEWGNLMTNGHVVDPEDLLLDAFQEYNLETLQNVCVCEPKLVNTIKLEYHIQNLRGDSFTTEYAATAKWHKEAGKPCPVGVELLTLPMQSFGETGKILLKEIDDQADLAVITIPFFRQPFLQLGAVATVGTEGEVYNFALRSKDSVKSLEVRWGKIEFPCFWEKIGAKNRMVCRLRMFSKFGNSGSPLLAPDGTVVAVLVGKRTLLQDKPILGTYGVPAEYAWKFYQHVTGKAEFKPELSCQACGLQTHPLIP